MVDQSLESLLPLALIDNNLSLAFHNTIALTQTSYSKDNLDLNRS